MKHSKKFFSLLTAVAMTMSMLCITSFATDESTNEPINIMTDDFESYYSVAESTADLTIPDANGEGRFILKSDESTYSQNWYAASRFGDGVSDNSFATTGILPSPTDADNKVLVIEGDAAYYNRNVRPRVVYTGMNENGADKYTYKFDFYKGSENVGGGILFNYTGIYNYTDSGYGANDPTTWLDTSNLELVDYYMLNFVGKNNKSYGYTTHDDLYSTVIVRNNIFQATADINTTTDELKGMGDYEGTNYRNNATVSATGHDYLPAQTWFSVELSFYKDTITWTVKDRESGDTVQTGSWTDSTPICVPAGFAFHAAGQDGEYMYFDNVSIEKEEMPSIENGVCTYAETFSYTAEDGAVGDATAAVRANKNDYTIVETDAGSWKLSDAYSGHGFPGAYISATYKDLNLLGHQGKNTVNNAATRNLHYPAVINFEPATTGSVELQEFMIQAERSGASRYGIRIAISEDEQSYYEFGRGCLWDYIGDGDDEGTDPDYDPNSVAGSTIDIGGTGIPGYAPYVVKCVDGVRTLLDYNNTYGSNESARTWTVTVNGSQITVNVKIGSVSANTFSYTYTFDDEDGLLEKSAYPAAVYSSAGALFDNISMRYNLIGDIFADNGDGTATVTVVPARYLESGDSLDVVTAFYDENGGFISASETAMTTAGSHTVDTPASYSYAKVMMYDGDTLVKDFSTKEETVPAVSQDKIVVACVGDSNTGNGGKTTSDTWSTKIGALLGENYDVQNYGRAGYRLMSGFEVGVASNPSYIYSEEYEASLESNADIVIIMLGTNDGSLPLSTDDDTTKRDTFKQDYLNLIAQYQAFESNPEIIITVPPIRGTAETPNNAADTIRPVIQEISQELGLRYVDMTKLVTDYSLLHDALHFVDEGYFQFAEHFYNAINRNVTSTLSDDKQTITVNSDASFDSNIVVSVYKDGALTGVKVVDASVLSADDYDIDVSSLGIDDDDKVKVMILDSKVAPHTYSKIIANKDTYAFNGDTLITGNTTPNATVGVTVYNGEDLVYADTANADRSGYYEFVPELDAGTYTVNTTAGMNTTITVE